MREVKTMTLEEKSRLYDEARKCFDTGNNEKAMEIFKRIPIDPAMAKIMKECFGEEYIKESGLNYSEVEATYGKDWINK